MLAEALFQKLKLFRLRCVQTLVNRVKNFLGLLNHGKCRADWSVCLTLCNKRLRRATNTHTCVCHLRDKVHQRARRFLVRKRHDGLGDRHTVCLNECTTARRNAEDVSVLTCTRVGHEEAGEIVVHASIKKLAPCSCNGVRRVAKDVQQANVIETHAGDEGVLNKPLLCGRQVLIVFVIVPDNRQDLTRRLINRHDVRNLKTRDLFLVLMLKARNVEIAIDFVNQSVAVIRVKAAVADALLAINLALISIFVDLIWR